MTKFYLIPNRKKDVDLCVTKQVMILLLGEGATVYLPPSYTELEQNGVILLKEGEQLADVECVITVGGDGTVLDASRLALRQNIPLLGINLGRLGYLAELEPGQLNTLKMLITGGYAVKERMVLKVTLNRRGQE